MNPYTELRKHKNKLAGWNSGKLGDYVDKKNKLIIIIEILEGDKDG